MKQIGVGADIHMGLFDDNKYVRDIAKEFSSPKDFIHEAAGNGLSPNAAVDPETGELLSQGQVDLQKKAKEFADNGIQALNLSPNREAAKDWWRDQGVVPKGKRKSPLSWLKDNSPAQFQRLMIAYENVVGLE